MDSTKGSGRPLTRSAVARVLGCSVREIRRLEENGVLHPTPVGPVGTRIFDPDEVERIAANRTRARMARAATTAMPAVIVEGQLEVLQGQLVAVMQRLAAVEQAELQQRLALVERQVEVNLRVTYTVLQKLGLVEQ